MLLTIDPLTITMNVMETVAVPADRSAKTIDLDSSPLIREMMHTGFDSETINNFVNAKSSYNDTSRFMEILNG